MNTKRWQPLTIAAFPDRPEFDYIPDDLTSEERANAAKWQADMLAARRAQNAEDERKRKRRLAKARAAERALADWSPDDPAAA
jgi:hypothetical protein